MIRHPHHQAPPLAAFSSARFTATFASVILYLFLPRLLACATDALAAAIAVSSLSGLPTSASAASFETHGMGATWPITTRADFTVSPFIVSATAAVASGQSKASF